jgi:glycosyltransferase involved in cell wall biosynthesis
VKILLLNQIPEVNNKYTFSLARGLMKQNIDLRVCCIEDDDVSAYTDVPMAKNIFASYSKEKGPINKVLSYKKSWDRLLRYCVEEKIDILHIQWCTFSPLDYVYHKKLRKAGIKIVVTIHDLLPFNSKFYDAFFHKCIYKHADAVINQARENNDKLINEYDVKKERLTYIPHGHFMEYAEPATFEESREKLNLPMDRPIILMFGQIKKVKGLDVLLESLPKVVKKYPDALCLIAGKVWKDDFSSYQNIIDRLGIQESVRTDIRFVGDDEIKYYFNAADVVALPYRQIYQSGVVQLAYAYEKAIVATKVGEFLSVIKPDETGILINPGNADELADALIWYLDNPKQAAAYGKAGKADIMVRLSWDTIGESVVAFYEKTIK